MDRSGSKLGWLAGTGEEQGKEYKCRNACAPLPIREPEWESESPELPIHLVSCQAEKAERRSEENALLCPSFNCEISPARPKHVY
jgi:hypothetical protein